MGNNFPLSMFRRDTSKAKKFKKGIDKSYILWYNITTKESEVHKMEFAKELISVLIGVAVLGILFFATWGICDLINYIDNKKHKKWCTWVFQNYPELKGLLSEYQRLETECDNLLEEIERVRKIIDASVEKNNYLPERRRIDKHIEELKEQYQELIDTHAKQYRLSEDAKKKLDNFWITNFPDLPKDKWILWWSE